MILTALSLSSNVFSVAVRQTKKRGHHETFHSGVRAHHGGDVGAAFDWVPAATDRLWHVARLAWRTLPYAFARAGRELSGPVAFDLRGPNGDRWSLTPDAEPSTTVRGDTVELCLVAAQRARPEDTSLRVEGSDPVLELVRTYA